MREAIRIRSHRAGVLPAPPDETTTVHMGVTFTEPDVPASSTSSSSSADDSIDGSNSDAGDSETEDTASSHSGPDPRSAAAEVMHQHGPAVRTHTASQCCLCTWNPASSAPKFTVIIGAGLASGCQAAQRTRGSRLQATSTLGGTLAGQPPDPCWEASPQWRPHELQRSTGSSSSPGLARQQQPCRPASPTSPGRQLQWAGQQPRRRSSSMAIPVIQLPPVSQQPPPPR